MSRFVLFIMLAVSFSTTSHGQTQDAPCTDVALYDLKNSLLSVKDDQALALQGSDQDALSFKNGICEIKDDVNSDQADWRYEMVDDFMMRPTRQVKLRVIRVFENHLSGSGSWDRVMAFQCHGGKLEKIWQYRFAQGIKLKRVNEIQFKVSLINPKSKVKNSDFGLYQWDNTHTSFKHR